MTHHHIRNLFRASQFSTGFFLIIFPGFQHTPVHVCVCTGGQIQDFLPHAYEHTPLQRFCEEIRQHILCGTECYLHLSFLDLVHDEKIAYVQVLGSLAT